MGGRESGELRCSDAEREAAVTRLRDATGEGRLALEELAERVEAAYAATTRGDLAVVTDDLPARAEAPVPAQRDDPAPAAPTRRRMLGIMGGHDLRGPMRLEPECRIVNVMGGTDLDLTQAHLEEGEVTIRIFSLMGGSAIRVPHGVHLDHSGFSLMGGDNVERGDEDDLPGPGAPTVRIRTVNIMGGTTVKRGPRQSRRWPWQRDEQPEPPPSDEAGGGSLPYR